MRSPTLSLICWGPLSRQVMTRFPTLICCQSTGCLLTLRQRRGRERECELALGLWCELALSWPRVSNNHIQRPSTFYLFTLQPLHASTSSRWRRQGGGAER